MQKDQGRYGLCKVGFIIYMCILLSHLYINACIHCCVYVRKIFFQLPAGILLEPSVSRPRTVNTSSWVLTIYNTNKYRTFTKWWKSLHPLTIHNIVTRYQCIYHNHLHVTGVMCQWSLSGWQIRWTGYVGWWLYTPFYQWWCTGINVPVLLVWSHWFCSGSHGQLRWSWHRLRILPRWVSHGRLVVSLEDICGTSEGLLWGTHYTMKSTGDNECPCGAPTVKMKGADMVLSIVMVIFVSDSTSHMIRSMLRNEYKTSRSFFRRIVSNAHSKSLISISITYL